MGWTTIPGGIDQNPINYLQENIFSNNAEVIARSSKSNTAYFAVKAQDDTVSAFVILFSREGGFSYKIMHESEGPMAHLPAKKVLNALTPTSDKYALKWRQSCVEAQEALRHRKAKTGDIVRVSGSYGGTNLIKVVDLKKNYGKAVYGKDGDYEVDRDLMHFVGFNRRVEEIVQSGNTNTGVKQ